MEKFKNIWNQQVSNKSEIEIEKNHKSNLMLSKINRNILLESLLYVLIIVFLLYFLYLLNIVRTNNYGTLAIIIYAIILTVYFWYPWLKFYKITSKLDYSIVENSYKIYYELKSCIRQYRVFNYSMSGILLFIAFNFKALLRATNSQIVTSSYSFFNNYNEKNSLIFVIIGSILVVIFTELHIENSYNKYLKKFKKEIIDAIEEKE